MTYYIAENNERRGPFTLEQLAAMDLSADTLVWSDGMETWERAENVEVLRALLISRRAATSDVDNSVPPTPTQQPEVSVETKPKKKRGCMGCLIVFFALLAVLVVALFATCPKEDKHKEALTELANDVVRDEMQQLTGGLGTSLAQSVMSGVLDTFFNDAFKTYDYKLFSVTRFDYGGRDKLVSVGFLGQVFTADKEVVSEYIHNKIKETAKDKVNGMRQSLLPQWLQGLYDEYLGDAINGFIDRMLNIKRDSIE